MSYSIEGDKLKISGNGKEYVFEKKLTFEQQENAMWRRVGNDEDFRGIFAITVAGKIFYIRSKGDTGAGAQTKTNAVSSYLTSNHTSPRSWRKKIYTSHPDETIIVFGFTPQETDNGQWQKIAGDLDKIARKNSENVAKLEQEQKKQSDKEIDSEYKLKYSTMLLASKNLILRGAPGTGKTYLAKQIAADIISKGTCSNFNELQDKKNQVEFVQFHPSYDYSDFVEGLRPIQNDDGSIGFDLKPGVFKKFIELAKKNESKEKPYVFIIDEINRGEISKIFGELFFAIDPGYRGKAGEISTQYSNMHGEDEEKFYIPENVYIIGTMNDIDRSVDSFDFAMRRRFRFVEIKAEDQAYILDDLKDKATEAKARMKALNEKISKVEELNDNYHIGPSYFLKLKDIKSDVLWLDYIQPLLQEYVRGMHNENLMGQFESAYKNAYNPNNDKC